MTTNPIILQRADPQILLHSDNRYYFIASVPEYDRIELRRADSITALSSTADVVTVWHKPDSGPTSDLIWAPEIHHIFGHWVIYFAAAPNREIFNDAFQHRMYALTCHDDDPINGQWTFAGQVDSGIDTFCLDATAFTHQQQHYYVWAQKHPVFQGNSCLYIATLADATTLSSDPVMISRPEFNWEIKGFWVNEGPAVLIRNGKVFISYSASATDERYCMGLLWAGEHENLLDAEVWQKSPKPVFASRPEADIYGPGHNSFTRDPERTKDYLVYHARNYTDIQGDPLWDPNRHTCVQTFDWDDQGFPVFGEPQPEMDDD
ncbi:glycoside hydrolase family 43 protein [Gynuella sp.]|uniref:glycoside hydrolase family 43 protein n=1 Tax=Gynuella sp. TaxID=2969146 RepID=UPI003D096F71